jgi:hypothetical protein
MEMHHSIFKLLCKEMNSQLFTLVAQIQSQLSLVGCVFDKLALGKASVCSASFHYLGLVQ